MAVDQEGVFGSGARLELGDHILNVPVAVGQAVHKLQVETAPRFLKYHKT